MRKGWTIRLREEASAVAHCAWRTGRRHKKDPPHIRFCETNPPFFDGVYDGSANEYIGCGRNLRGKSVGSFSKTNPPVRLRQGYGATRPTRRAFLRSFYPGKWVRLEEDLGPRQDAASGDTAYNGYGLC